MLIYLQLQTEGNVVFGLYQKILIGLDLKYGAAAVQVQAGAVVNNQLNQVVLAHMLEKP
jgi:hypothetical protein